MASICSTERQASLCIKTCILNNHNILLLLLIIPLKLCRIMVTLQYFKLYSDYVYFSSKKVLRILYGTVMVSYNRTIILWNIPWYLYGTPRYFQDYYGILLLVIISLLFFTSVVNLQRVNRKKIFAIIDDNAYYLCENLNNFKLFGLTFLGIRKT